MYLVARSSTFERMLGSSPMNTRKAGSNSSCRPSEGHVLRDEAGEEYADHDASTGQDNAGLGVGPSDLFAVSSLWQLFFRSARGGVIVAPWKGLEFLGQSAPGFRS